MPNITGRYNFHELCQEARASAPWVKKVQRLLKLGEGEGVKGTRTYYSGEQVHIYSAVKKLRLMDLEFEDIQHIFEIEKKLKALSSSVPVSSIKKGDKIGIILPMIILLPPDYVLYFSPDSMNAEKKKEFAKLYQEYNRMLLYVKTKADEAKKIATELSTTIEKFEKRECLDALVKFPGLLKE